MYVVHGDIDNKRSPLVLDHNQVAFYYAYTCT